MNKPKKPGRPRMSFAEKIRRSARPHETAGEVVARMMPPGYGATLRDAARHLERCGFRTPSGKLNWSPQQAYFEWYKARAARGRALATRIDKQREMAKAMALVNAPDEAARVRLLESWRQRELRGSRRQGQTYPLRTKIKTVGDRARAAWWEASKSAVQRGEAGPPEPLLDSRGRPLKGRRFSKIRKVGRPRKPP